MIRSEELFFATRTEEFEPVHTGFTDLERRAVTGHRWCSAEDIRALAASGETVYPYGMAELLDEADTVQAMGVTVQRARGDGQPNQALRLVNTDPAPVIVAVSLETLA